LENAADLILTSIDWLETEILGLSFELPELPGDEDAGFHDCQLAPALQATVRFYCDAIKLIGPA
jgi:hypothetical protein